MYITRNGDLSLVFNAFGLGGRDDMASPTTDILKLTVIQVLEYVNPETVD